MVSAGHHLAAQAAFSMLEAGGNAADAGVAAVMVLAVVQPDMVNVAGVSPMMIHDAAKGQTITIDGLGVWPTLASVEFFEREHDGMIPEGILRSIVPGAPSAWIAALKGWGRLSFGEVAEPALRFARDGFAAHEFFCNRIAEYEKGYRRFASNAEIYLPRGKLPQPGQRFVQADLARQLQYMVDEAAKGADREAGLDAARAAFYEGDIAATICDWHAGNGGLLRRSDFAGYQSRIETPLMRDWRGLTVATCGPWCQGPVLLQVLKLLEPLDLKGLGHNSVSYIHTVTEAIKLAFADRETWYGDPLKSDIPTEALVSEAYAAARRALIDPERAAPGMPEAGEPRENSARMNTPRPPPREWDMPAPKAPEPMLADTSYACVVDGDGNVFSGTPSDASWDGEVVPGTGMVPSTRGCQSRVDATHPARVGPGHRPRLTPNPAMVFRDGRPIMPFGTPGGDAQVQAMTQVFLNIFEFGMDVQSAVEAPRFMSQSFPNSFAPHQYYPGRLNLEPRLGRATGDALAEKGHRTYWWPDWFWRMGSVCTILVDTDQGVMHAGADPRHESYAIGW